MQILFDVRLLGRGGASGIEEYTRSLIRSLLTIDHDNDYSFFYNGFRKKPLDFPFPKSQVIDWHIPNKILDFSTRFLKFPVMEKMIKTDLIFSPHFNILESRRAPRVITFHDLSFLHHPYFFSRKQRFWHWLQNVKRQAKRAAEIIAVSEFTKTDLINFFDIPPDKITVVYSGISNEFKTLKINDREAAMPYILYLGTLEPRKNVPALIRAFNILKSGAYFKNWQLIIAGRPGWLYKNILKEAEKSPYSKDIVFKGGVSVEERVLLYNLAKVFVYPSFFEGFGFPPLEAQACGCPVIVSDRTSLPEVMGKSALFTNPWKVRDLADAIKEVVFNKILKEKLVKSGYENVKKFNWEKTAEQTLNIFRHAGQ